MRAGFPYMGDLQIPLAAIIRELGAEVVCPGRLDERMTATGVRLAPESMCIPFKTTLGVMERNLALGADTLVYSSGRWSCRFGYYGYLQELVLRDLGYRFRVFELTFEHLDRLLSLLLRLSGGSAAKLAMRAARAVRLAWAKSAALDWAGRVERRLRPRIAEPARAGKVTDRLRRDVAAAETVSAVLRARRSAEAAFNRLPLDCDRQPLRIRVVGESYCVLEPAVNFDVLRRLGDLGVEAVPFETAHEWLGFHSVRIGNTQLHRLERACAPWWRMCVGGEDLSALGWLALAPGEGFDGVLHLHPFACMPSTAVEPGMQQASEQLGIPLLGLALDEHTSEAGVLTRLEAFVSLLERRRLRGKRLPGLRGRRVSRSRQPVAAAIPRPTGRG